MHIHIYKLKTLMHNKPYIPIQNRFFILLKIYSYIKKIVFGSSILELLLLLEKKGQQKSFFFCN